MQGLSQDESLQFSQLKCDLKVTDIRLNGIAMPAQGAPPHSKEITIILASFEEHCNSMKGFRMLPNQIDQNNHVV